MNDTPSADEEGTSPNPASAARAHHSGVATRPANAGVSGLFAYAVLGMLFGIVLAKSEVISWFRIQEMFRFQAFHMYGIIGSAIGTAALSLQVIKRLKLRSRDGSLIVVPPKTLGSGTRYWLGGALFGLGWALVGACPGPLFALIGGGLSVMLAALASAIAGTWTYGALRPRLPH